jgi:arylsulfatase A-like enzyme
MKRHPLSRRPFAGAVLLLLGAFGAGCGSGDRPSVLLITLDTTRADVLGCYGAARDVTPNLDRLAAEGVLFTAARSAAPLTLPAHASILTGLYPLRHSARSNTVTALPESASTIAELAQESGIETAAFVAASVLDRSMGVAQGFDSFDQPPRSLRSSVTAHYPERPANEMTAAVLAWFSERDRGRPFFVWVHYFDPHSPYAPPADARARAGGDAYAGEVSFMDEAIGELLDGLRAAGQLDRTLVVAVGDHGEGLGDHGEATHGSLCYDSTIRVPLLVRLPDGAHAGERVSDPVSVVDVYPTIAATLGLRTPAGLDGVSLLGADAGTDAGAERGVYFESLDGFVKYGWSPVFGWADARGKFMQGAAAELYDVAADPGETRNLARDGEPPERYESALRAVVALERLEPAGPVDPELRESLESLGYTGGVSDPERLPGPLERRDLPDPRERLWELSHIDRALALGGAGRGGEAIALLSEVTADNPRNGVAMSWLATFLIEQGRCPDALVVLRETLAQGIEFATTHNGLGHCLLQAGNDDEALVHFKRALELDPGNPIPAHNIALVLERRGQVEEARRYRELAERAGANAAPGSP